LIEKQNSINKQHGISAIAVVMLMHIFSFIDTACAVSNITVPYFNNANVIDRLKYDERQTGKNAFDELNRSVKKTFFTIPMFGISAIPQGFISIPVLSSLFFGKGFWNPEEHSETTVGCSCLPVVIPRIDKGPYFQSVHLSDAVSPSERICFSGTAKDDIRLKSIKVMVRTPSGSGFEVLNELISGCSIDLSEFCIDSIADLYKDKKVDYEVILTVKDSADQVIAKTFFISVLPRSECQQDMYGGQCVNYVRDFFGGRYDLMPGLCLYEDCAAYHAWDAWDLGYGKGHLPEKESILVLDKRPLLYGHVAVVSDWKRNADNTYTLTVCESNWDRDELIDCNVRYTYFPETSEIIREGRSKRYDVAGFIYSDTVQSHEDIPPEYENATLPNLVTYPDKAYFKGVARDDIGLKEVKIEVSGPRGNQLPVYKGTLNGISKDLSDLWFDSGNSEYAGVEGHYIVKLIVIDTMDQAHSRIFPVLVNGLN
jgi:surface antigen